MHIHTSLVQTAELYAVPVLGIAESDITFSAAKLFFAYGLGNGLTFPMAVGATSVLMAERPTPAAVSRVLREHRPTIFFGVPTLYNAMLVSPDLPRPEELALRRCVSAGEPLPQEIGRRWSARLGVDILDGIGSTEMLHIFLSNRPDEVRYGTTGKPLPGYPLKIVDEEGRPIRRGEVGDLLVSGPTSAALYWNNRERSRSTFNGLWTRTGDKYFENEDGYYVYCGRSDDMLKVSGMYVSPAEVEAALIAHEDVLEVGGRRRAGRGRSDQAQGVCRRQTRDPCGRRSRPSARTPRQDYAGAVQMPALDRFSRRAAKDRDRQDPALQIARRQRALAVAWLRAVSPASQEIPSS